MAVFQYSVTFKDRENMTETGTVVASNETEARAKLSQMKFQNVKLKRLTGLSAWLKRFSADIR